VIRRKRQQEEHENHERWLISYADFITLLFTFFAALYALSSLDKAKADKFSGSIRQAFSIIEQPINLFEERNLILFEDIRQIIHETPGITMRREPRGTVITLSDAVAFAPGSAELKDDIKPVLERLAVVLKRNHRAMRIEGHTDNLPLRGSVYRSNWELSTARAASVLSFFLDSGLTPELFSIAGYGEYRPIADNETPEGRAKNRRVEIVVLP